MKYYILLLLLPLVLVSSCITKKNPPIPPAEMKKILMDIHFAEVYSMMLNDSTHRVKDKNVDSLAVFYRDILKHHKLTEETLMQSMEYYRNNPEDLDTVYNRMLPELSKLEGINELKK